MQYLFIDEGASAIKFFNNAKQEFESFPSLAFMRKGTVKKGFKRIVSPSAYTVFDMEKNKDVHYTVDAEAIVSPSTKGVEYQYSDINNVFVYEAMRRAGITSGDVTVVCTMPVGYFYDNPNLVERKKKALLLNRVKAADGRQLPRIVDVDVVPEGETGGYYVSQLNKLTSALLSIDIGGYTTDITLVTTSGVVQERTSIANGTLELAESIANQMCRDFNMDTVPTDLAMDVLRDGVFEGRDYSAQCRQLIEKLIKTAVREARKIIDMTNLKNFAFIGGGGHIAKKHANVTGFIIPDRPEMMNVMSIHADAVEQGLVKPIGKGSNK